MFNNEVLILEQTITASSSETSFSVSSPVSGISTTKRFEIGSYIQIDSEIMRIAKSTLSGSPSNKITVLRGVLGTIIAEHTTGSLIKKIKVLPIEFRRPSILRASGHTFEYLGYGPGNYSTGLPQVQLKSLSEKESYLVQSQQRSGGSIIYTGMNNDGDFYIGNTKYSASSGQQTTFAIPTPTITGLDPSRLSVVYDEVTVKERLLVEGGNSGTILSQFDGPVTFNNEVKLNDVVTVDSLLKVTNAAQSTTISDGSAVYSGGIGIAKNLNVGGNAGISGNITVTGTTTFQSTISVTGATNLLSTLSVTGNTTLTGTLTVNGGGGGTAIQVNNGGDLALFNAGNTGSASLFCDTNNELKTNGNVLIGGALNVTGDITAFFTSDQRLKDNITPIPDALSKVLSISGNTFDWNEKSEKEGNDVGVIAQEVLEVLPEAVTTRENGYLAVRYEKIVPLLIEAIKDLTAKVEDLQNQINNK